jgi:ATP-dependent helicase/nuclease subunit A
MTGQREPALPDRAARERAVTGRGVNQVIVAGAGPGKTSLLVERLLHELGSGSVTMDAVCAITFTEKAAAELAERVAGGLDELSRAATAEPAAREDETSEGARAARRLVDEAGLAASDVAERSLRALERLDEAHVTTIHGLCSRLLRAHPVESGIDPGFEVDTGERETTLLDEEWERFLADELHAQAPRAELWARVLDRFPLARVGQAARALARFGVPLDVLAPRAGEAEALARLVDEAAAMIPPLEVWHDAQSARATAAKPNLATLVRVLRAFVDGGLAAAAEAIRADLAAVEKLLDDGCPGVPQPLEPRTGELEELWRRARALLGDLAGCDVQLA